MIQVIWVDSSSGELKIVLAHKLENYDNTIITPITCLLIYTTFTPTLSLLPYSLRAVDC